MKREVRPQAQDGNDEGHPRRMRGVRHFGNHARGILQLAGKWLYCTVCGSLRPRDHQSPWFQPGDPAEIREWVLKKWGFDPLLLATPKRRRHLARTMPKPQDPHVLGTPWTEAEKKTVVAMRDAGCTWRDIARAFGAKVNTVRDVCLKYRKREVYDRRKELFSRPSREIVNDDQEEDPCRKSA